MTESLQSRWSPIALLVVSNVFMTFAWYGHLKYKSAPLWLVVLASWGIAFFEYCLMVPANRWGHGTYSATQLKIMQEVITILVFCAFAVLYLGEKLKWNHLAAFACIIAAVFFVRLDTGGDASDQTTPLNSQPSTLNPPQ
ncbi:MAG: DMT family protein [Verrucomicrobia bacterium]|nr:DMT family protein [Verrucomicrobiota bacterium]